MSFRGQSLPRLEDARFLTGRGQYIEDIEVAGQSWMQVVRSPHAHAAIARIDATAARNVPGVLGVFTAADLVELGPLPCTVPVASVAPMIVPPRFALASDRARHVGDPVAFVVAEFAFSGTRCSRTRRGRLATAAVGDRWSGGAAIRRAATVAAGARQPVLSLSEGGPRGRTQARSPAPLMSSNWS